MSCAIRQPGLVYRVRRRQRPTRITCVSSGTTSCAGETAQKQVEPFTRAAGRGTGKKVADAGAFWHAPAVCRRQIKRQRPPRKAVESRADVFSGPIVAFDEESFDRLRLVGHLLQQPQQRHDVGTSNPAVDDMFELPAIAFRIASCGPSDPVTYCV